MAECIGVCEIDYESGYCLGCGRSMDEIYGNDENERSPESGDNAAQPDTTLPVPGTPETE